jgi:DNA-binding NarL/FixJ family response regulator
MISQSAGTPRRRVRLMLVDDHEVVRQGVRALIESVPDWTLCAEASGSEQALKAAAEARPDIIVLDVSMPNVSGLDLILQMKKILPKVEILVLTMHDSERIVAQALRAGARGYLLKSDTGDKLIEAVAALARRQTYFSASVSETLLQVYLNSNTTEEHEQLTPRERQIVKLVAEGNSNKRIALILKVSVKTVETHRSAAMRKIGAKSSADLALYAARNELVQL